MFALKRVIWPAPHHNNRNNLSRLSFSGARERRNRSRREDPPNEIRLPAIQVSPTSTVCSPFPKSFCHRTLSQPDLCMVD